MGHDCLHCQSKVSAKAAAITQETNEKVDYLILQGSEKVPFVESYGRKVDTCAEMTEGVINGV